MIHDFLPICRADMDKRGWESCDFVYVCGDAYVDHPSFGHAIISRMLEAHGYKVGIIAQPDWKNQESIQILGEPRLGWLVSIEVENHIDDSYVKEENIKIEIHKIINEIKDEESLLKAKEEIEDRFGVVDEKMEIYMYEEWFEKLARLLNITRVKQTESLIELELGEDVSNKIEGDKLFLIAYNINPKFRLAYKMKKIYISLPKVNLDKHFIYYEVKLLDEILNMIK